MKLWFLDLYFFLLDQRVLGDPRLCTGVANQTDPAARLAMGHALGEAGPGAVRCDPVQREPKMTNDI